MNNHEVAKIIRIISWAVADLRRGDPIRLSDSDGHLYFSAENITNMVLDALVENKAGSIELVLEARHAKALDVNTTSETDTVAVAMPRHLWCQDVLQQILTGQKYLNMADLCARPAPVAAGQLFHLLKLANCSPVAVACRADWPTAQIVGPDDLDIFLKNLAGSYRRVASARVPLDNAPDARLMVFRGFDPGPDHLALVLGAPEKKPSALVRIHSECATGDLFGSLRCDCGSQLHKAIRQIASEGDGVILYLAQEGRGLGLVSKLRAYALQDGAGPAGRRLDTLDANHALGFEADERDFGVAGVMLRELGISRVRLMTNNPKKVTALSRSGIDVQRVAHAGEAHAINSDYLRTKVARLGHSIEAVADTSAKNDRTETKL